MCELQPSRGRREEVAKKATSTRALLLWVAALAVLPLPVPAAADTQLPPFPYVTTANHRRVYFRMIPDPPGDSEPQTMGGRGAAYQVTPGDTDRLLWTTEGWYAYTVFLSDDGRYLVRLGNWPRGKAPSPSHLAVAFYDNGKLLKSYATADLIRDASRIPVSVSHYQFYKGTPVFGEPRWYNFRLQTSDGVEYLFDVRDGSIESSSRP